MDSKKCGKNRSYELYFKKTSWKNINVGITSIGVDGETVDVVTLTSKPEVIVYEGMIFATSEKFYKEKRVQAEILDVGVKSSGLGRVVLAKAKAMGKILLSGPTNALWTKEIINDILKKGMKIVIVDGALSRMSIGSPIITEAVVLSTGAAVSLNIDEIVRKTQHIIDLINIEYMDEKIREKLKLLESGIYKIIWKNRKIEKLPIKTLMHFKNLTENIFENDCSLFISGALTERFLLNMSNQTFIKK